MLNYSIPINHFMLFLNPFLIIKGPEMKIHFQESFKSTQALRLRGLFCPQAFFYLNVFFSLISISLSFELTVYFLLRSSPIQISIIQYIFSRKLSLPVFPNFRSIKKTSGRGNDFKQNEELFFTTSLATHKRETITAAAAYKTA